MSKEVKPKGKPKGKQTPTQPKVVHTIEKDENGNGTIVSRTVGATAGSTPQPTAEPAKTPAKNGKNGKNTEEQRSILQTLSDLGGKDVHSIDIAKKLGFDKTNPKAPRAPVRNAMDKFVELGYVTLSLIHI